MKGPSPIFEGEMGFWNQVSGTFDLKLGDGRSEPFKVAETSIKNYPVEYHAMSAVEAALRARERMSADQIDSVEIETFTAAYTIIAKDPEKWDPRTRETADHSLPYIVAAALVDGSVTLDTFDKVKIRDERIRSLLRRTKVAVSPEHDKKYPKGIPNTVRLIGKDGMRVEETVTYPLGHYKNPMGRAQIDHKFNELTKELLGEERAHEILDALWNIDNEDLEEIMALLRGVR